MTDAQREAQKRYRQKHPEKARETQQKYRERHKEKLAKERYERYHADPEKYKEIARKCYQKNKEKYAERNKEYVKKNRAKITQMVIKRRKKVALELAEKGQIYTYLNKSARESKMIMKLAQVLDISEVDSKQMLIDNDWNYKKLIKEHNNNDS